MILQLIAVVLTNLSFIPVLTITYRLKMNVEMIVFGGAFFTSLCYHFAETMRKDLLGMTPGNWHRLDNICAILSFQFVALYYSTLSKRSEKETVRWAMLLFTLWCQERGPWRIVYATVQTNSLLLTASNTVLPVVVAAVAMLLSWVRARRMPSLVLRPALLAAAFGVAALYFFHRGLDDEKDWMRLNHGLWHFFAGLSTYFIFQSQPRKNLVDVDEISLAAL